MRVRPAREKDLEQCLNLDHSYMTDHVWQMETREEAGVPSITFRLARLPREVRVHYPRRGDELAAGWQRRDAFLVAEEISHIRGYVAMDVRVEHRTLWLGDLIVDRSWRHQGIGTALLLAAAQWGRDQELARMVIGVPTKAYPAIRFCQSRGFSFCGHIDHYWPRQDIALFFGQSLR